MIFCDNCSGIGHVATTAGTEPCGRCGGTGAKTSSESCSVTCYDALLEEARDQFRWFNKNLNEDLCDLIERDYYRGSRDAYGHMINAIEEAIAQAT